MVRGKSLTRYDVSNRNVVAVFSVASVSHFLNSCEASNRMIFSVMAPCHSECLLFSSIFELLNKSRDLSPCYFAWKILDVFQDIVLKSDDLF